MSTNNSKSFISTNITIIILDDKGNIKRIINKDDNNKSKVDLGS